MILRSLVFLVILSLNVAGCGADTPSPQPEGAVIAVDQEQAPPPDSATARLFRGVMETARREGLHTLPLGTILQEVGLQFRAKPYMAGMLDEAEEETLVCRLDGFDCVTFVESALALARGIAAEDYSYETFVRNLREQRYRSGKLNGYCSRLHYFSDWIRDNEDRGLVENITQEIGGRPWDKDVRFMTLNREKYPRLAHNDSLFECIREAERRLGEYPLYYVPKAAVRNVYDALQAGDIIATSTHIEGLDVTHTGLVFDDGKGGKGFLHASTTGGVKVSPDLADYLRGNKVQTGIMVARPVDPRR